MERNFIKLDKLTFAQAEVISGAIFNYTQEYGPEMLPKPPEAILDQFNTGQSVVLAQEDNIMFHATGYENLNERQHKKLGIQVVEFGSWIAMVRGQRIGVHGAVELLNHSREVFEEDVIFLATHKRINALNISLHDLKFEEVLYEDYPYLAYLTCTCENCSETFGFDYCPYRAKRVNNNPDEKGKIDCTLVISSTALADKFEERCRELHMQMGGVPLEPGEKITTERMVRAKELFEALEK
jgi:hypothetical protein